MSSGMVARHDRAMQLTCAVVVAPTIATPGWGGGGVAPASLAIAGASLHQLTTAELGELTAQLWSESLQ